MNFRGIPLGRAVSALGYAAWASFFFYITFVPSAFDYFLYRGALAFLIIEFISIHSTPFLFSITNYAESKGRMGIMAGLIGAVYSVFAYIASMIAGNFLFFVYFWLSSGTKFIGFYLDREAGKKVMIKWGIITAAFVFTSVLAAAIVFPIIDEFTEQPSWDELSVMAGAGENFIEGSPPGVISSWLGTYFSVLFLVEVFGSKLKTAFDKQKIITAGKPV